MKTLRSIKISLQHPTPRAGYILAAALALVPLSVPALSQEAVDLPQLYTDEQAEHGERVFLTTCVGCHGYTMIESFATYPDADEFFSVISLTMPWEDAGHLPTADYIALVAYMLREVGYPDGTQELVPDRNLLKGIVPGAARAE